MELQIQQQISAIRAMQLNAGIPASQWARNVMPMRKLVRLAILSAKARAVVDGKEFKGLTLQQVLKWLSDNGFGANYSYVAFTLSTLKRNGLVTGNLTGDSAGYFWNVNS